MNKIVKWILIILSVLIVGFVAVKAMGNKDKDGIKVTAEKSAKRTIVETVTAEGRVYPEVELVISPDISGEIVDLNVAEGDSVKRGQVLARIYADIYASQRDEASSRVAQSQASVANSEAALESLKAQLNQAQQTYNRNKALLDDKVISKAEFEKYETELRSAQSQYNAAQQNIRSLKAGTQGARTSLEQANKNLGRTTLVAPMDGVISSLSVKKGERVAGNSFNVGTEMMRVANMSSMEVKVEVGENDIVKVNLGDSADVDVEAYSPRKFKGVVTQIANSTKTGNSLTSTSSDVTKYEVRIRLDPASYKDLIDPLRPKRFPFRPGMNASADIKTKKRVNVVSVPIGAVVPRIKGSDMSIEDKKKEKKKATDDDVDADDITISDDDREIVVFVIDSESKVQKRTVTTGIQDINYYEITNGLKEGETVVTAPFEAVNKTLKSGKKVNVVEKEKLYAN